MFKQSSFSKFIILSGILLLSISPVFAATINCDPNSMTDQLTNLLNRILALFSWLWIPFAIFAGKLMGNGFIYGEFFNLDKVLYFLWNLSRTFANFLIVVLIIGELIKQFAGGGIDSSKMMKYILKMWWGILLANMSWFLIGATIDVSTILTTTIGALPSTYIAQDSKAQETMQVAINNAKNQSKQTIHLTTTQCDGLPTVTSENKDNITEQKSTDEIMDMILPWENSVSWPLMYLGIGVLRLQDFLNTTNIPDDNLTYKLFVISTRVGITLLFMVALIVLVIINIFRIVAIWFFVSFAPLLILLNFADKDKSYQIGLLEKFSIPNIVKSIFAPVVAVGLMSIGLIVIVIMQWFLQINSSEITIDNVSIKSAWAGSSIGVDGIFETTIAGDLFGQNTWNLIKNTFSNILLIIFTLFILYGIIKALAEFLKDGIGWPFINDAINLWTRALWSLRMVPLPWGWFWSINSVSKVANDQFKSIKNNFATNTNDQDIAISNMFNKKLGMKTRLYSDSYKKLDKITAGFNDKYKRITKEDYNNMIAEYNKEWWIIQYYQWENIALSWIGWQKHTLEAFFRNLSTNTAKSEFGLNNFISRDSLGEEKNVDNFIKANYWKDKNNQQFFKDLYTKLWGDATKLNPDGSNFRNQPFRRAWATETPPTTP